MKKTASKVAKPAQIQPKSRYLFNENLPLRDFSIMTLHVLFFPNKIIDFRSLCARGWSVLWECYMVVAANRGNHHFSNFAEIF